MRWPLTFILLLLCGADAPAQDDAYKARSARELLAEANDSRASDPMRSLQCFEGGLAIAAQLKDSSRLCFDLHSRYASFLFGIGAASVGRQQGLEAMRHLAKANAPPLEEYLLLGLIATMHLNSGMPDSAMAYYQIAAGAAKRTGDPMYLSAAWNNIGLLHLRTGRVSEAMGFFARALEGLDTTSTLYGSVTDNLADLDRERGNLGAAKRTYMLNLARFARFSNMNKLLSTHHDLARVAMLEGKAGEARDWLLKADALPSVYRPLDEPELCAHLRIWQEYHLWKGDPRAALSQALRLQAVNDSLSDRKNALLNELMNSHRTGEVARYRAEVDLREAELAVSKAQKRLSLLLFIAVGIGLLMLTLYIFLLYRGRLRNQTFQRQMAETRLRHKEEDVSEMSLVLMHLRGANDRLMEGLAAVKGKPLDQQKAAIADIVRDLRAELGSMSAQVTARVNIDRVNHEFNAKLQVHHPNLTPAEMELCGMVRLGLDNNRVASLKNVTYAAAKKARYRLRKKLGLSPEDDLTSYLEHL